MCSPAAGSRSRPASFRTQSTGQKSTEPKTVQNLITTTRKQLGRLSDNTAVLAENDRYKGKLELNAQVKTDLQLLAEALKAVRDPFER